MKNCREDDFTKYFLGKNVFLSSAFKDAKDGPQKCLENKKSMASAMCS